MGQGMIQKLIGVLMNISASLGAACACAETERIAVMVHRVMSFQARQFHTLEHVFGFLDDADAVVLDGLLDAAFGAAARQLGASFTRPS